MEEVNSVKITVTGVENVVGEGRQHLSLELRLHFEAMERI